MLVEGEFPTVSGLADERVQDVINKDMKAFLCQWARERHAESKRHGLGLGFGVRATTHYLDRHLVSIDVRTATISERQTHPAQEVLTFNYLLSDGSRIELSDVFHPYDITLESLIAAADDQAKDAVWGKAWEEQIRYDAFLIDTRGVEFVFPPCYLNACAAGYISIFAPYANLVGLIDPRGAASPYL